MDTISEETAFDPAIVVNGADGCVAIFADDGFACTYPPPMYECPATTLPNTEGVHQILVLNFGSCADEESGSYRIDVAGDGAETLTLVADDADRFLNFMSTPYSNALSACGEIYREGIPDDSVRCEPTPIGP